MKKMTLVLLILFTISLPQVASAITPDYFLLCKGIQTSDGLKFPKGTLFRVADFPKTSTEPISVMSGGLDSPRITINPELGFYFHADNFGATLSRLPPLLIKNTELIETACGQHDQEFSIGRNTFTDLKPQLKAREEQQKLNHEEFERRERKLEESNARIRQANEAQRLKDLEKERKYAELHKAEEEKYRAKEEEAARKKQAILQKYNVKATVSAVDLRKNPFQFEDKVILLTGASFDRMLDEKGLSVFKCYSSSMGWVGSLSHGRPVVSTSTEELLVSRVPKDFSAEYADLIVKCKGTTKATNNLGAVITVPLVEYIAVCEK